MAHTHKYLVMSKARTRRAQRNIVLFFLSFIYVFVIGMIGNDVVISYLYYAILTAIYFSAVLVTIEKKYKYFYLAVLLMLIDAGALFFNLNVISIIASVLSLLFFIYVIIKLVTRIAKSKTVGTLEFLEAINIYFLIGIIGSILFRLIYINNAHAFNYPGTSLRQTADFLYFSFVTMTTLGYGDITPSHEIAKALAIFLSFTGQLYLAMIVAMLVGKYLSQPKHDEKK